MTQQVKVFTYELSNGKYFYRKYFALEPLESHMEKMLEDGWTVQSQNVVGGQTNIAATTAKAIITGGLSLIFGDTNKKERLIITYVRNIEKNNIQTIDSLGKNSKYINDKNAIMDNLKSEVQEAMKELNQVSEDVWAQVNDVDIDRQVEEMHDNNELSMTVMDYDANLTKIKVAERYSTGELKSEGFQIEYQGNVLRTGNCIFYWLNGQKMFEGTYQFGLKNGHFVYWNKNGVIVRTGEYCNGVKVGKWIYNDENGNSLMKGKFKRGKKDGLWIETNDDGEIVNVNYTNGIQS